MLTLAVFKRVGKVPVVKERSNKSASCSEISFLSIFKTLHRILYGPVNLLISREERINLISSLLVKEKMCQDFHLRGNQHTFYMNVFFFCLGLFTNGTEIIVEDICYYFWIINAAILKSENVLEDLKKSFSQILYF